MLPRPLKVGDDVRIVDIDKNGVVLSLPDASGNVEVQAGIIRTRVPLTNLQLVSKREQKRAAAVSSTRNVTSRAERSVRTEIDLRGMTTDEAILEADQFIDDAVLSGVEHVTLIHGKGTGALRTAIHQHLRSHPSVKSFRLGVYGEGETGVTVVELK